MENTSGQGKAAVIPPELGRWNWGAFLLNWIWGLGNRTYIALLALIPFVGLVMVFVLGFKGNAWAWRNQQWESVEHFKRVQRKWTIAALILIVLFMVVPMAILGYVMLGMKDSEIYQLAVTRLQADKPAMTALGAPVTTGFPWGNFKESGDTGSADFSFSVEGPKGKGEVLVNARRAGGKWTIDRQGLQLEGSGDIRMIGAPPKAAPRTAAAAVTPAAPAAPVAAAKDAPPPPAKEPAKGAPPTPVREPAKDLATKPAPAPVASTGKAAAPPAPEAAKRAASPMPAPAARRASPPDADARACLEQGSDAAVARCAERYR